MNSKAKANDETEISDAIAIIYDDDAGQIQYMKAAEILYAHCKNYSKIRYEHLLQCLTRKGVPAEIGARALNIRSGRKTESSIDFDDFIVDLDWWIEYLKERKLVG